MQKELILEIIRERWSPCSFSSLPVEEYKLKAMFEAASFAPSSRNDQPWMFVYTTRQTNNVFSDYLDLLNESNRQWAKNAYSLIISLARTRFSSNGDFNRHALYDTGMAVANLLIQALAMDIYVHQMGGFSVQKVRDYLRIDESIEPVAILAVGYLGDGTELSPELQKKDEKRRPRKSVKEYVYRNKLDSAAY
jgi:nitroreductase